MKIDNIQILKKQKIVDAMKIINKLNKPIIIFTDKNKKLIGTLTDGDIRRYLLKNKSIENFVGDAINLKPKYIYHKLKKKILYPQKFKKLHLAAIPIIKKNKFIVDIIYDENENQIIKNNFVIMAGGRGFRMMPLTNKIPKPLINYKGNELISRIIDKAYKEGFRNFVISLGYMGEKIKMYLNKKYKDKINIEYTHEKFPLGTAGALSLMKKMKKHFVISNTDVITDISYKNLLLFHLQNKAEITMGSKIHKVQIPFGVLKTKKSRITDLEEKPVKNFLVNAGIYVMSPQILKQIPRGKYLDMTTFIEQSLMKRKVVSCPIYEKWDDIGSVKDLDD